MAFEGDSNQQIFVGQGFVNINVLQSIPLSAINSEDSRFRITTKTEILELVESIQQLGLIHPPILKRHASEYVIISGFRRIAACRYLGWIEIPARILSSKISDDTCIQYAIADNTLQRPLNLVEISRSLFLLSSFFKDENQRLECASILGLPDNLSLIKKIEKICHLPKPIQDGILKSTISMAMGLELSKFEPNIGVALVKLFDQLKIGLNKQREIILLLDEIALRENTTIDSLLNEKDIKEILDNDELDRARKQKIIRVYLHRRRFPTLFKTKNEFEKLVKELKLGNSIKLMPPKDFEGPTYTLKVNFHNLAELKDFRTKLDRIIRSSGLQKILTKK
ncbi:MAG: ParB N-terminal domain-containing protein [Desulfobacterales bacterium]|nr:MAG: ParB N-terminal domain-containing protein [Desulfobacterales bacterium]